MSNIDPLATAIAPVVTNLVSAAPAPTVTTAERWYAITAKDTNSEAEISIYDAIGAWGIGAEQFVTDLESQGAGNAAPGMAGHKQVIRTFVWIWIAHQPAAFADGFELRETAGD